MSIEQIAVATAVMSATVSAAGLLLAWHRGSDQKRPKLLRALGGVTLFIAAVLIGALALTGGGGGSSDDRAVRGPVRLTADEYRLQVISLCEAQQAEAKRIHENSPGEPVFGETVQLETRITEELKTFRPPQSLETGHRKMLSLWERRLSLLGSYYDRFKKEIADPSFRRELRKALKQVDALTKSLQEQFEALGVTPECRIYL
jgi:hypothetical protein